MAGAVFDRAANLRFEEDATLEVRTTFRRPDTVQYLYEAIETDRSLKDLGEASVPCRD